MPDIDTDVLHEGIAALEGLADLLASTEDLHSVDSSNLATLLRILTERIKSAIK